MQVDESGKRSPVPDRGYHHERWKMASQRQQGERWMRHFRMDTQVRREDAQVGGQGGTVRVDVCIGKCVSKKEVRMSSIVPSNVRTELVFISDALFSDCGFESNVFSTLFSLTVPGAYIIFKQFFNVSRITHHLQIHSMSQRQLP